LVVPQTDWARPSTSRLPERPIGRLELGRTLDRADSENGRFVCVNRKRDPTMERGSCLHLRDFRPYFRSPNVLQMLMSRALAVFVLSACPFLAGMWYAGHVDERANAQAGYRLLTEVALLPADFSQETFDQLWTVWPQPLRDRAEKADADERRRMAFERYGLTPRPGDDSGKPLQYVVDDKGNWTMNCLSCHGGSVEGAAYPGAPNNRFGLQTLTEEIRRVKFMRGEPMTRMDLGSLVVPLGTTHGTTNAVVFGQGLMNHRDSQLNVIPAQPTAFVNHDMDAPPWWNFHKREVLYIDGFTQKDHRPLMQFALVPENGPEFFHQHEDDFRDVYAYLSSLRPPKYPYAVDAALANQGRMIFEASCSECHGTYGEHPTYPNLCVPIDVVGTDPTRLNALTEEGRKRYADSWFAHAKEASPLTVVTNPGGYVAPPLDGVWASPPYFHNGSVPTLWHVLHPDERPVIWHRTAERIDRERVGFVIDEPDAFPWDESDVAIRRTYFDTRRPGKSNSGHLFPNELSEAERTAVLEYLKTL